MRSSISAKIPKRSKSAFPNREIQSNRRLMQRRDEQGEEGKSRERQPDSPGRCHFRLERVG